MARKIRAEEPGNHERWVVSYADFVTLLFAFFVVMYSISSVNEDKYRVLSNAMGSAFYDAESRLEAVRVADLWSPPQPLPESLVEPPAAPALFLAPLRKEYRNGEPEQETASERQEEEEKEAKDSFSQQALDLAEAEVDSIAAGVEQSMDSLIDDEIIDVKRNKFWLEVEIKSSLLFTSGSSVLIPESVPLLKELSNTFVGLPNRIHIEGFTDNKPISTPVFPSNWELSSARAAAVVRLFERNGVEPSRLASIGYGEYHPVADNDTEEGRAKNRRVVIVVMAALEGRQNDRIYEFEMLKERSLAQSRE